MPDRKRIAFISGDIELFRSCREVFEAAGRDWEAVCISRREELTDELLNRNPVSFVVDERPEDKSAGMETIQWIRRWNPDVPIIALPADSEAERRIELYRNGADGCVLRPFYPEELEYLIWALVRRRRKPEERGRVALENATVDIATAEVTKDGTSYRLTGTEYRIFRILLENAGRIVPVSALCEGICGENWEGYEKTLMTHIYHLREKIEAKPSVPVSLVTIKGLGYRLNLAANQSIQQEKREEDFT